MEPATRWFDESFVPFVSSEKRFARQHFCGPPPEFLLASSSPTKAHHLSGLIGENFIPEKNQDRGRRSPPSLKKKGPSPLYSFSLRDVGFAFPLSLFANQLLSPCSRRVNDRRAEARRPPSLKMRLRQNPVGQDRGDGRTQTRPALAKDAVPALSRLCILPIPPTRRFVPRSPGRDRPEERPGFSSTFHRLPR